MLTTTYDLAPGAAERLAALVSGIAANPGAMLRPEEVADIGGEFGIRPAFDHPPLGMTRDDLTGVLKLALLTESATDTYAAAIDERASRYDAPWLGRFIRDVWVPDERLHHTPYRAMLISAGITEDEIDAEIARTCDRALDYRSGDTPVHLSAYGMIQEYVTDNWHGLIAGMLRPTLPRAAYVARRVKQRETLHTLWYRDMTAIQVESNPRLLKHVAEAVAHFEMPGKSLVPELEPQVPRWLNLLGNDFERWAREIGRLLYNIAGDTARSGQLIMQVFEERGSRIGPLPAGIVRATFDRLGERGYGLLGEALLERVGLGYLYRDRKRTNGLVASLPSRLRGMVRRWLAAQIDTRVEPETPVAEPAARSTLPRAAGQDAA